MTNGKIGIGESQMIEACFCEHCLEIRRQQERLKEYRKLLQKEQNPVLVTGN